MSLIALFMILAGIGLFSKIDIPKQQFLGIYRGTVKDICSDSANTDVGSSSLSYDFFINNSM